MSYQLSSKLFTQTKVNIPIYRYLTQVIYNYYIFKLP